MSSKNIAEKKAPSTPTSTTSKKRVASPTPRSTAMAEAQFYSLDGDASLPKIDEETSDALTATRIVNEVFNEKASKQAYKRRLEDAFNNPPFKDRDISRIAEKEFLKNREDLQDLGKMEAAVSMANRGQEMARMSPDQMEIEVAHELLDLKQAAPIFEREIGDRSTPIPDIEEDLFVSSAENSPVRKSGRNKKGGGGRNFTIDSQKRRAHMKTKQAQKFYELLHYHIAFDDADKAFQEYLKQKHEPELINKEHRLNMFANIESSIADEFDFESHIVKSTGGKRTRSTRRRKQTKRKRHLKKGTKSRKTKRRKRRTLKK